MHKNSSIKKLIFINAISVVLVAAMLVTASLAWFTSSDVNNTPQEIQSGTFEIKLHDGANGETYAAATNIDISNTHPMTDTLARAETNNIYKFKVVNTGTVDTMFRFDIAVSEVKNTIPPAVGTLANFLRYEIRYGLTEVAVAAASWEIKSGETKSFLTGVTTNVPLKDYLDELLIDDVEDIGTTLGTLDGDVGTDPDTERFFEIRIWLDSAATTDVAGITATITFTLQAIQAVGGATWTDFDA